MPIYSGALSVEFIYRGEDMVWPYQDRGDAEFIYVGPETSDRAAFSIGRDLIVDESDWAVQLYIPPSQIISTDAESVTIEA